MSLDLYAKVEHLLGIEESTEFLHDSYMLTLEKYDLDSVLDIGCGRGGLMKHLNAAGVKTKGIDLSQIMVDDAKKAGLDVECIDLCDVKERFDAAVAVFDVLNFMDAKELDRFLYCVSDILNDGGYFIADINSLKGFSDVAQGTMNAQDEDENFLSVDAVYSDDELRTIFTYFTKQENGLFEKEQATITQYYHPNKFFRKHKALKLVETQKISLYDTDDKILLVFQK